MYNIITSTLLLFILLTAGSCKKDEKIVPVELPEIYQTCCGVESVETRFDDESYVYVPNAFTPNKDSINDKFRPYWQGKIMAFTYMVIHSLEDSTIIYDAGDWLDSQEDWGWDGTRTGTDWEIHKGGFRYEIVMYGEPFGYYKVEGIACAIACDEDAGGFKDKAGCFYPSMLGSSGELDKNLPSGEADCFR